MSPGGIAVSVISPTRYLGHFAVQSPPTVHYVGAHRVLTDPAYGNFYRDQADRGAHIVVDNGVFELGTPLAPDDLLRAARAVRASELVLPDHPHDGRATCAATADAARLLDCRAGGLGLCGVIQGRDDDDWRRCLEFMSTCGYLSAIALPAPKRTVGRPGLAYNRVAATHHLEKAGLVLAGLDYRLLGLGDSGHLELERQQRHSWISSVDCATPVIMGALGRIIEPGVAYRKPDVPVDSITDIPADRIPLVHRNIAMLRAAARCAIAVPEGTAP